MSKTIDTGHIIIDDETEGNAAESILEQQDIKLGKASDSNTTPEKTVSAKKAKAEKKESNDEELAITLQGAATFLSHGILFKQGIAQPVEDDALRKKLIATGLFKV